MFEFLEIKWSFQNDSSGCEGLTEIIIENHSSVSKHEYRRLTKRCFSENFVLSEYSRNWQFFESFWILQGIGVLMSLIFSNFRCTFLISKVSKNFRFVLKLILKHFFKDLCLIELSRRVKSEEDWRLRKIFDYLKIYGKDVTKTYGILEVAKNFKLNYKSKTYTTKIINHPQIWEEMPLERSKRNISGKWFELICRRFCFYQIMWLNFEQKKIT